MALQAHQEAGLRRPPAHQDLIPVRREVHIRPAVLPVQHIPAAAARQAAATPVAAIPAAAAHLAVATAVAAVIPVADVVAAVATVVATVPAAVVEGDSSLLSFCQMIVKQLDHS